MNNSEFVSYLNNHQACKGAISWVGNQSSQEAWKTCSRPDWMEFLLNVAKVKLPAEYKAKLAPICDEYEAKLAPIWAEYEAKLAPIYAEYKAKLALFDAEYLAKLALFDAEYLAKQTDLIRESIPTCPV
jgi:hypothetical protein